MAQDEHAQDIAALRGFNRAYTNRLGLLNPHLDGSPFTLSEARILYELARRSAPTAAEIGRALHLDRGQISRTLKRFSDRGLVEIRDNPAHGRQQLLSLTATGHASFDALDRKTQQAVSELPPRSCAARCSSRRRTVFNFGTCACAATAISSPLPGSGMSLPAYPLPWRQAFSRPASRSARW